MTSPADATELLDRHFLEVRARMLEIAATLDRLDRAQGSVANDPRRQQFAQALEILSDQQASRAERLQRLFSRQYDEAWRKTLKV